MRMRRPRLPLSHLNRCYGTSACLTVLISASTRTLGVAVWWSVAALKRGQAFWPSLGLGYLDQFGGSTGGAVVAVWILMFVGRTKPAEWDWIEVLGTFSGCAWALQCCFPAILALFRS
jgi:hypothetical protein